MTIAEAIRILHPDTTADELNKIENYGGFSGRMARIEAVRDACIVACEALEKRAKMSCATCKHSRSVGHLYACYSTEVNITSSQTYNFYCSKWEEKK